MTTDPTSGQALAMILAGAVPVLLAGLAWLRSEFVLRQAKAEAERAKLERELAMGERATAEAHALAAATIRNEVVALGAALGGGASSPQE